MALLKFLSPTLQRGEIKLGEEALYDDTFYVKFYYVGFMKNL
jgi:hypothetical protein